MPSFQECLAQAVAENAITKEEAAELDGRFAEKFAQKRLSMGDRPARSAAKESLEAELRAEAIERARRIELADGARGRLKGELQNYRSPAGKPDIFSAAMSELSGYGLAGYSSMRGRFEAILSLAHSKLEEHIRTFRRTAILGRRLNKPLADDVMRELHGESTGVPEAASLAKGLSDVAEDLRQRFNAAGGAIPKLDDWGWSHIHDRNKIFRAGREAWKTFARERLDPAKMLHPLTGEPFTPASLEKSLDVVFDSIVSDGWARHQPVMRPGGKGAVASQRQDARFLVFKNADAWLEYDRTFGQGDPVAEWFEHIKGMARDISAMESFGPNPAAMVDWMKQVVRTEIGKGQAGHASLSKSVGLDAGELAGWRIESLYNYLRGASTVSSRVSDLTGDVRNFMTSALLGGTSILAAATDPFIDAASRRLAGLPTTGAYTALLKVFASGPREEAVRAGFMADDFVHILKDEARYAGFLNGNEWSRWLADRALTYNLLQPLTTARRHVHQLEWQSHLADQVGKGFDALPDLTRRAMQGFGIDRTDWDVMRTAPPFKPTPRSGGFLRPADIEALDHPFARRTAEKYVEMVTSWLERAVPTGTPNARSIVTGSQPRGSIPRELVEGLLQFKSFSLSFTTLQLQAMALESARGGRFAAAKYAGALMITLTLGAALANQLRRVADGKDPEDMKQPDFWMRSAFAGGGLGIYGDFLKAGLARNGQGIAESLVGPQVSFGEDVLDVGMTGVRAGLQAAGADVQDANVGRTATRFLSRYTPVASTHWATRAAWNRVMLDQLQYLTDPEANKSFKAKRRADQYWWEPGRGPAPQRSPNFSAAVGGN